MKIAIHIFTIYMLALSLVPCGDGGGGIVEIAKHFFEVEHSHITDHDQHSNNCGDDNCSPFCICSCCSSGIDYPVKLPLQIKRPILIVDSNPSFAPNNIAFSFNSAIWHPPTLS